MTQTRYNRILMLSDNAPTPTTMISKNTFVIQKNKAENQEELRLVGYWIGPNGGLISKSLELTEFGDIRLPEPNSYLYNQEAVDLVVSQYGLTLPVIKKETHTFAWLSIFFGMLSIFIVPVVFGVLGIVMGILEFKQNRSASFGVTCIMLCTVAMIIGLFWGYASGVASAQNYISSLNGY